MKSACIVGQIYKLKNGTFVAVLEIDIDIAF